ncbi:MAG: AI-2E family transporter [Bacteroidota bacterium]
MNGDVKWSLTFRYIAAMILFIAVIAFLIYARVAVRVFAVAAFVAYLIDPAVVYLSTRTRMSRTAAVNLVFFSALILLIGIPATLAPIFYDEAQIVVKDVLDLATQIQTILANPIRLGGLVIRLNELGTGLFQLQNTILTPLPEKALQLLETTSVNILWLLITIVSIHFFLSQWPNMRDGLIAFAPPPYRPELQELYQRIRRVWMGYLRGQIVLMLIVGVVFTIAWTVIGIPGALVLGVIAGLLTLIPDVGPFIAAGFAVAVALLEGSSWIPLSNFWVAGITVLAYLVLIGMKNFFLRPIVMGRSVHINEALVFVIIMIATILEGILGALLIVPLYATTVVIFGYLRRKILGQPPFDDDGANQFVMPEEKINPPGRKWGRRATDRLENASMQEARQGRDHPAADRKENTASPEIVDTAVSSSQAELDPAIHEKSSSRPMPIPKKE